MKYYQDEERTQKKGIDLDPQLWATCLQELMLKISQKMGGLPSELQPVLKKSPSTSL